MLNQANVLWLILATAMVLFMIPGLAMFYGGLVSKKNLVPTMMMTFIALPVLTLTWFCGGYTLAFGADLGGLIGDLSFIGLNNVGLAPDMNYVSDVPLLLFMAFQMMFAIITAAIISGSIIERMRLLPYILFITFWSLFVYSIAAHWVWGGGWLADLGVMDFAGGTVVHITSGFSGLIAALILGKRQNRTAVKPNWALIIPGLALLFFGWFGFNGGSALAVDGIAVLAVVNTALSAAMGAGGWLLLEYIYQKELSLLGIMNGILAGLVAITPGAGFVSPTSALLFGLIGGMISYIGIQIVKNKMGYDDALDAFGIHGLGGFWGMIATGTFATEQGLLAGNGSQILIQITGALAIAALSCLLTFVIIKTILLLIPASQKLPEKLIIKNSVSENEI